MKTHTLEAGQFIKLNCDSLRWSHTHFIRIPVVHIISFCVSFLSRVDELNKLAGLQCMGLHSSGWQSTAALTQRPRARIPLKPRNPFFFFRAFSQLLKLRFTAMVTYSFHLYSRSSHHFKIYIVSNVYSRLYGRDGLGWG